MTLRTSSLRAARASLSFFIGVSLSGRSEAEGMPSPLDGLGDDTLRAFTGVPLLYYGGAVVSTLALSASGGDDEARVAIQKHVHAPAWGDAAFYGGYVLPVLVAPGLFLGGLAAGDRSVAGAGSAAFQALGFTVLTTVVLKVGTGRPFPLHGGDPRAPDRLDHPEYAKEFSPFGFGGRYAWPSGHTSSAVAIAASLTAYAPGSVAVPLVAYSVAAGIGVGMMVGHHHWASDVLAGGLIGQAIGWSVGSAFRERADRAHPAEHARLSLVPLFGPVRGCALFGEL